MDPNRIPHQIEMSGVRRLAGCVVTIAVVVFAAAFVVRLVARHASHSTVEAIAYAIAGVLLGLGTSILTPSARQILKLFLTALALLLFSIMFVQRTLFGWSHHFTMIAVISPLLMPLSYVITQRLWNRGW